MARAQDNVVEGYADVNATARAGKVGNVVVLTDHTPADRLWLELSSRVITVVDVTGTDHREVGSGRSRIAGPTEPGTVIVLPEDRLLEFAWSCGRPNKTCIVVDFGDIGMYEYVPELFGARRRLKQAHDLSFRPNPTMTNLAALLSQHLSGKMAPDPMFVESALRAMALATAAHVDRDMDLGRVGRRDQRLKRAVDYIESEFAQPVSLLELSAISGLSPSHLTELFQREFGCSPYSFLIERRLTEAMRLIAHSSEPLARIAFAAGFVDQSHMTRAFRARVGCTPAQYRREVLRRGD